MAGKPAKRELDLETAMTAYRNGEPDAFLILHPALRPRLRSFFAVRAGAFAEDLTQETFLQMHRARRAYAPDKPLIPWLLGIARHVLQMHRRRMRTDPVAQAAVSEAIPDGLGGLDGRGSRESEFEDSDCIAKALGLLTQEEAQILAMRYLEEMTGPEIARRLGIRKNCVRTRLHRARKALGLALKRFGVAGRRRARD